MEYGHLKLGNVKYFIIDECDKVLKPDARSIERGDDGLDMRRKVQALHMKCPRKKQVMMFTATLDKETRALCRKFMSNVSHCNPRFCMRAQVCVCTCVCVFFSKPLVVATVYASIFFCPLAYFFSFFFLCFCFSAAHGGVRR